MTAGSANAAQHKLNVIDLALMLLSLVSIGIIVMLQTLALNAAQKELLSAIDNLICLTFFVQFSLGWWMSPNRQGYFKQNWLLLLASIPMIDQLRFLRALHVLRVVRLCWLVRRYWRSGIHKPTDSVLIALLVMVLMTMFASAGIILYFEEELAHSPIQTGSDALWWALVTVSTVGYGDTYPVSFPGRLTGSVLIMIGVGLYASLSGYLARLFLQRAGEDENEALRKEIGHLRDDIQLLHQKVDRLQADPPNAGKANDRAEH